MYFTKTPHPANFAFATEYDAPSGRLLIDGAEHTARVESFEGGVYHITIRNSDDWNEDDNLISLLPPPPVDSLGKLHVNENFEILLKGARGRVILKSRGGMGFGKMARASMFCFECDDSNRYFGLGEKTFGRLEVSRIRTKFWNTDAWADFHFGQWDQHPSDPYYLSVPYVIVEREGEYVGLLFHNPYAPFIETGAQATIPTDAQDPRSLILGATSGLPSLWIITGPKLADVTRKLQRLVGVTPLPPLWALGYHQSRWGYAGEKDLKRLDKQFSEEKIPCDALWLDIDYMDEFRVFTFSDKVFPKGAANAVKVIAKSGRRVVPILDPGVKQEIGYGVYDCGKLKDIFCKNPQGNDFVGMVWPGRTVFPDFSLQEARDWWADYASDFKRTGFAGAWLDMNDPSTGAVDPQDMCFRRGKKVHAYFHNQYALGMQVATRQGFLDAESDTRPFLLSRSGWVGTSRYAAVWTGDNVANRFYLKGCIPTSLNLSLSGIPFCGPDVGGFAGDTSELLMLDWVKCCFLFPFMRNHSVLGSREQEPWNYSRAAVKTLRHYIRLRYKFLPYLYNLFINQEIHGDPILRPLLYHFEDPAALYDEFLIGSSILQAPFVEEDESREVVLPGESHWFDAAEGKWRKPGVRRVRRDAFSTPLFIRESSIIPMQPGERESHFSDLSIVEFHVFQAANGVTQYEYSFDDGETFAYKRGTRSRCNIRIETLKAHAQILQESIDSSAGDLDASYVFYKRIDSAEINGRPARIKKSTQILCGKKLDAWFVR